MKVLLLGLFLLTVFAPPVGVLVIATLLLMALPVAIFYVIGKLIGEM